MAFLLGGIIGPAFGGAVIGISLRAPFFLYAGTLLLAALAAATLLPAPPRRSREVPRETVPRMPLPVALRNPAYQAALAGNFAVGFSVLGVRSTVVPLLVVQGFGLAPGWIGAAFTLAAFVSAVFLLPAGKAVDTIDRRPTLVAGGLLTAAALGGLAVSDGAVGLMLSMALFAVGGSLLGVAPAAIVGDVVEGRGGTAVALWQMSSDAGSVIGPVTAGLLIDRAGFGAALWVSAAVVAACALLGLRVPRGAPG